MIQELFHAFVGLIIAILLTLRIYALYDCNKRILFVLSVLILIGISLAVTMDLMASSMKLSSLVPSARCHDVLNLKGAALTSVGWEAIFFYDILLLGMTLRKAHQVCGKHLEQFRGMSLFSVTVRDGTIYYA
ncbi:hypothetical protein BDP27DRAFT_518435 [Rhodocollybia butyracea]|uniref:Uncharacterized protein n=1 Tax=Rhodocollybia butyracea TaxID=206335 RepID=A0A9P5U8X8_9AGAR|nr:hypothetical protein BDP27DRAFT_518435 [Rhodocollybia butyracea]